MLVEAIKSTLCNSVSVSSTLRAISFSASLGWASGYGIATNTTALVIAGVRCTGMKVAAYNAMNITRIVLIKTKRGWSIAFELSCMGI